jgi:hypothetical protein
MAVDRLTALYAWNGTAWVPALPVHRYKGMWCAKRLSCSLDGATWR